MKRARYVADQKATAVGLAVVKGQRAAAEETGVPLTTLHGWFHSAQYEQLRTTTRDKVAEAMWVAIQEGIAQLREGLVNPKAYLRDKVAAFEALSEKRALLVGEATTRTETRAWTDDLGDTEKERLRDWIDHLDDPGSFERSDAAPPSTEAAGTEVR